MKNIILFESYSNETSLEIGGKGLSLCKMAKAGISVPAGFCLTVDAFKQISEHNPELRNVPEKWLAGELTVEQAKNLWTEVKIPEKMCAEIEAAYKHLGVHTSVAVRSSAALEDSAGLSFAGQFETCLGIVGIDDILNKIKYCWASLWNERVRGYIKQKNIPLSGLKMAIVIQKMVPADVAGVMFTADPVSGSEDDIRIESCFGLAEPLVSGTITPDAYVIEKQSGKIKSEIPAEKTNALSLEEGKVINTLIPKHLQTASSLDATKIKNLLEQVVIIEEYYQKPQDIEWAFEGDSLYILQSRDITTLKTALTSTNKTVITGSWTRENMEERFYKVSSPFTISTLYPSLEKGMAFAFDKIGIRPNYKFGPVIKVFYGRPYLNKALILDALKGIKVKNTQMETVIADRKKTGFNPRLPIIGLKVIKLIKNAFDDWEKFYDADLKNLTVKKRDTNRKTNEIIESIENQLAVFDRYWGVHMANIRGADFSQKIIRGLLDGIFKSKEESFQIFCRLSSGFTGIRTVDSDIALHKIVKEIAKNPDLKQKLIGLNPTEYRNALMGEIAGEKILKLFDDFLSEFGYRMDHQEFQFPLWCEKPEEVWNMIAGSLKQEEEDPQKRLAKKRRDREEVYEVVLSKLSGPIGFIKKKFFNFLYLSMKKYMPARENDQFFIGKFFYNVRQDVLSLGDILVSRGLLDKAEDVFYLEWNVLRNFESFEKENGFSIKEYTKKQKQEFTQFEKFIPPLEINNGLELTTDSGTRNGSLKGFAVNQGIVTANANITLSPDLLHSLRDGEILVTHSTSPAWTPVFGRISALVTEAGGMLSHGAIMAREYNIPAVMGIRDITKVVKAGKSITVDGNIGEVYINPN